jgi:predicted nucleotidyltransferase component of viral defense system
VIPARDITAWRITHPWATDPQVEQDLVLTRAICEISAHPLLGQELVFRGGTALHKLFLPVPYRYSEDLDFTRTTAGGIGPVLTALRQIGDDAGFRTASGVGAHPKVLWRTTAEDGTPIRIKVEINAHERSPALPLARLPLAVQSGWWSGRAQVQTFQAAELVATKIRALYQRKKGRDLFDLWLALTRLELDPGSVLDAFPPYRPTTLTAAAAIANLKAKLADPRFTSDLEPLTAMVLINQDLMGFRVCS